MAYQITVEEFNHFRITKSEKEVVLPALKDTFKTLWEKEFPQTPWRNDEASVKQFEDNVKNACKKKAASGRISQKEEQKIKRILGDLNKDESWYKYEWDISALSKVLVDCRLFDLEAISVELCGHIKGIKDIRNEMAHATAFGIEEQEFKDTMKSLKTHLKGLSCVISVDDHLHTLEQLESEDIPNSTNQQKDMCHEIEIMKVTLKWCQEKENRLLDREKFQEDREKFQEDREKFQEDRGKFQEDREKFQKEEHELKTKLHTQEHVIKDLKNVIDQLQKNEADLEKRFNEYETKITQKIDAIAKIQSHSQTDSMFTKLTKKFCPCFYHELNNNH